MQKKILNRVADVSLSRTLNNCRRMHLLKFIPLYLQLKKHGYIGCYMFNTNASIYCLQFSDCILSIQIINYKIGPSFSTTGSPSNFRIVGRRLMHSALQFGSSRPSDKGLPTTTKSSRVSISANRLNSDQSLIRLLLI